MAAFTLPGTRITALAAVLLTGGLLCTGTAKAAGNTAVDALQTAHDAAQSGSWDLVRAQEPRVQGHVLEAYPEYWWLRQQLNDVRKLPPEDDLNAFMARYRGSYLAERLRSDWLLTEARTGDYATVLKLSDTTVTGAQTDCAVLTAKHASGIETATAQEAMARFSPGEACWALYDRMQADGVMQWSDFSSQLRTLMESNDLGAAKRMGRYVFSEAQQKVLTGLLDQPMIWLVKQGAAPRDRAARELLVVALGRLPRSGDLQAGYDYFRRSWAGQLSAADAAWVRNQFALAAAYKLDPSAVAWYKAGEQGGMLTDYNQGWRARAVLHQQPVDWRLLVDYIDRMPNSLRNEATWVYWRARGLQALGSPQEAQDGFRSIAGQFNFYGQLAGEELGMDTIVPPAAAPSTPEELAEARNDPGLQRAVALLQLGWRSEGLREWNYAMRGMSDRQLLAAAQFAHRESLYDRAVNAAERTREQHDFNLLFLTPFKEKLVAKAREIGIDENWVYGLIRQESRFVMNARSAVGASGLMQLMPGTALWVARKIGLGGYAQHQVNDMDTNLTLGTNYLRIVQDNLDGSALLASAGYNAGPKRPRTWQATLTAPMEGAIFAETIPFNETRDYVKKVLSNSTYYAALMSGKPQSLKARLGTIAPQTGDMAAAIP